MQKPMVKVILVYLNIGLKQKNVLAVHGSGFGTKYGSDHFRIVYLPNMEILESAMNKIEDFVR